MAYKEETVQVEELSEDAKERLLGILEKATNNKPLTYSETTILFYYVRHQNDPAYNFVPEEYRSDY